MEHEFIKMEWELIDPRNIHFTLCNHDGLIWNLTVGIKTPDGMTRGMPIGDIIQGAEHQMKFVSNMNDKEYAYRMIMSGKNVFFYRRMREKL